MIGCVLSVLVVTTTPAVPRVYVAPVATSHVDGATGRLVEDRVLVAARALGGQFDVVGASDLQGILDMEATRAAVGCDTTSCANEVADALAAEQVVTSQLGRIGSRWQLTLTRTERKSLRVLARTSREAQGDTPEGLLNEIPGQVRELFGVAPEPTHLLTWVGASTAAIGAGALATGAALYAWSWREYLDAESALANKPAAVDAARAHAATGEAVLPWAYVVGGIGIVALLTGAALVGVDVIGGSP